MKQKEKYKGQNELKLKKYISLIIVFLAVVLSVFLILLNYEKTKELNKQQNLVIGKFESIKDILEYYECDYKKEKSSQSDDFKLDIYAIFKYDLYNGEKSNEEFYNKIIEDIAKFLDYSSFRIFDNDKEEKIEIDVICDGTKIKKIYINGIEDYFIFMDSQFELGKFENIELTDFSIDSQELIDCIENNWVSSIDFGTRESIFQNYNIFFDEGIKVRKIDGKIYNIIFTDKYEKSVINGFTVGTKSDIIKGGLGEPTFYDNNESIIGYKGKDIYVFFEDNQISVYRNIKEDGFDDFFSLVDEFVSDKYSLKDFMNELTYMWPDYEEYTYDSNTIFISYPNRGIDIKINYDNTNGIVLYNNIGVDNEILNKYLNNTDFVAKLKIDNIFEAEKRRIETENGLLEKCEEFKNEFETESNKNHSKIYDYYMKLDSNGNIMSSYFISNNSEYVNCELNESIENYIWLNDFCFIYSKTGKGIYYYDLKNQIKEMIITGNEKFEIKSYENGILKYDETQIEVRM